MSEPTVQFVFTCPQTGESFSTDAFDIVANHGVRIAEDGTKFLDAEVALRNPCPHCGQHHQYRANELSCPFGA